MHTTLPQSAWSHPTALLSLLFALVCCVAASLGPKSLSPGPASSQPSPQLQRMSPRSGRSTSLNLCHPSKVGQVEGTEDRRPRASDRNGSDSLQPLTSQLRKDSASCIRPSNTGLFLRAYSFSDSQFTFRSGSLGEMQESLGQHVETHGDKCVPSSD